MVHAGEGAFATVDLCELLPHPAGLNRSFSMPAYVDGKDAAAIKRLSQEHKPAKNLLVAVKCLKPVSGAQARRRRLCQA